MTTQEQFLETATEIAHGTEHADIAALAVNAYSTFKEWKESGYNASKCAADCAALLYAVDNDPTYTTETVSIIARAVRDVSYKLI